MITRGLTDSCCMYLVACVRHATLACFQFHNCAFKLTIWSEQGQCRLQVLLDQGSQMITTSLPASLRNCYWLFLPTVNRLSVCRERRNGQGVEEGVGRAADNSSIPSSQPDMPEERDAFSPPASCIKCQGWSLIGWLGSHAPWANH